MTRYEQALCVVLERLAACETDEAAATEGPWAHHELFRIGKLLLTERDDAEFYAREDTRGAVMAHQLLELLREQMWADARKFCRRALDRLTVPP